ncbi:MAG: oxidoreductase [Gemmatimonadales bacterium]
MSGPSPTESGNARSALLLGATGLVGSECLRLLMADDSFSRVVVASRRKLDDASSSPKLESHMIDLDRLAFMPELFVVTHIFCALGTTVRQTPSRDVYRKIDFDYLVSAAKLGFNNGATHFLVVSAVGANARSPIFYNRLKGEMEDAVTAVPYRSMTIARPSVLVGDRPGPRLSEKIAWKLAFITPRSYKPVKGTTVARALINCARADEPGLRVIPNRDIERIARG